MRRLVLLAAVLFSALPVSAQNSDIEALAGLQFNFGNPGARALGMGGAFIGLADDASAAVANPAGLTILRKPEVSIEARQTSTSQSFVTGGTYPFVTTRDYPDRRTALSYASVVMPVQNAALAVYYHRSLSFRNGAEVGVRYATPVFYFGPGGVTSREQCDPASGCTQHSIYPFTTSADLQIETIGVAAARQWNALSFGLAARYHRFKEVATTFRRDLDAPGQPTFAVSQTNGGRTLGQQSDKDVTLAAGVKWSGTKVMFGAVYQMPASFPTAVLAANPSTAAPRMVGRTTFHMPSVAGVGAAYRPVANLTVTADLKRVGYSKMTDDFVSVIEFGTEDGGVVEHVTGYRAQDATEIHTGIEYYVTGRVPFAIRGGWWHDPGHSIVFTGPLDTPHAVAARILFPEAEDEDHFSVGIGVALRRFQVDAAYDTSRTLKTASVSLIARY